MNAKDLPDPYGFVYNDEFEGGCFGYPHDDVPKKAKPVYTREQVEDILSQRVKTEKFYKPGFFNLPHFSHVNIQSIHHHLCYMFQMDKAIGTYAPNAATFQS